MNLKQDTLATDDLWLAAFLICRGIDMVRMVPSGSRHDFVFEDERGQASHLATEYKFGPAVVRLRDLRQVREDLLDAVKAPSR